MQIRDSNRAMLLAAAAQEQCTVRDLGLVGDDKEELERVLDGAFSSGINILLTSGGVSMGDKDFVKPLLEKKGTVHFNKVVFRVYFFMRKLLLYNQAKTVLFFVPNCLGALDFFMVS